MNAFDSQSFPVLRKSEHPILRATLEMKLQEYKEMLEGKKEAWRGKDPNLAFREHRRFRDAWYKVEVLQPVLDASEPKTVSSLRAELQEKRNGLIDQELFDKACSFVFSYLFGDAPSVLGPGESILSKR